MNNRVTKPTDRELMLVGFALKIGASIQHQTDGVLLESEQGVRFATFMVITLAHAPENLTAPVGVLAEFIIDEAKEEGLKT